MDYFTYMKSSESSFLSYKAFKKEQMIFNFSFVEIPYLLVTVVSKLSYMEEPPRIMFKLDAF